MTYFPFFFPKNLPPKFLLGILSPQLFFLWEGMVLGTQGSIKIIWEKADVKYVYNIISVF